MISVVIAAERQLLRDLLFEALNERGGLTVAAMAPDQIRTLALVDDLDVEVVLVSMLMPDAEPLVRELLKRRVNTVTLGYCGFGAVAMVEDGTVQDVIAAIHAARCGAVTPCSGTPDVDLDLLTPAERRVLELINEGQSNKEIARALGVAIPTVKHHVHRLLSKLGVRRRGEAAALYQRQKAAAPRRRRSAPWTLRTRSDPQS